MDVYAGGGRWVWSWGQMGVVIMETYKQVVADICRCTSQYKPSRRLHWLSIEWTEATSL